MTNPARILPLNPGGHRAEPRRRRAAVTAEQRPLLIVINSDPNKRNARNGHTADCPYAIRREPNCPICRSERLGAA